MKRRRIASALIGAVIASTAIALNSLWPQSTGQPFYQGQNKLWAHRTLSDGPPENTIEGMRRAFELGVPGVEIDVVFDAAEKRLYVLSEEALAAGERPTLSLKDMLSALPRHGLVWIDFWTLRELPSEQARTAIGLLHEEIERLGLIERAIVESRDAVRLAELAALGCRTSLWIEVAATSNGVRTRIQSIAEAARQYRSGSFSAVSLDYHQYDGWLSLVFARVPIHLFTVNDPETKARLMTDDRVKIILTDSISPAGDASISRP